MRWVLAPRTTWQARRLAADFGEGMDARTAWVMARLARHPDERGYAMAHLDDERRATDLSAEEYSEVRPVASVRSTSGRAPTCPTTPEPSALT